MMITAYRGDGLRAAPEPITSALLSDAALITRARAELDANAHAIIELDLAIVPRANLALGQLVATTDPATMGAQVGKITGISIDISEASIATSITVECPQP